MIEKVRASDNFSILNQFVESDFIHKQETIISEAYAQLSSDITAKARIIGEIDRAIFEQNDSNVEELIPWYEQSSNPQEKSDFFNDTNSIEELFPQKLLSRILDDVFSRIESHAFVEASTMIEINLLKYCFVKTCFIDQTTLFDANHYFRKFFARYVGMLLISKNNPALKEILRIASSYIVLEMPGLSESTQLESLINQVSLKFDSAYKKLRDKSYLLERRTCESEYGKSISWAAKFWANRTINDLVERFSLPDFVLDMLHNEWSQLLYLDKLKNPNKSSLQSELTLRYLVASLTNVYEASEIDKVLFLQNSVVSRLYERLSVVSESQVKLDSFIDALKEQHDTLINDIRGQVQPSVIEKQDNPDIIRLYAGKTFSSLGTDSDTSKSFSPAQLEIWVEQLFESRIPERSVEFIGYGEGKKEAATASKLNLDEFLLPGCWYLIKADNFLVSAKLSTKLEANSNYVFVDSKGLKFNAFTDAKLIKMIKDKEILALEESGLTESCINAALSELVCKISDDLFLKLEKHTLETQKRLAEISKEEEIRQKRKMFLEKNAELLKKAESEIGNLSVGAWLKISESDIQKRLKIGAILQSSKEVVLVDRNGFKSDQIKIEKLAEKVVKGECVLPKDDKLFDLSLR